MSLLAVVALLSCSKKEDPIKVEESPLTITLKSDAGNGDLIVIGTDQTVQFEVLGSDGENYSEESQLYVNNEEVPGSSYVFSSSGEYTVRAEYGEINSNVLNFQVLDATERALTVDVPKALRNQTITFGLIDPDGNNTASDATFFVNGEAISGFTFSSSTPGSFEVYAVFEANDETFTTPVKTFEVFIPKRKVVVEDYTGTWCGFCPAVALAIENLREETDDVSVVAIHKTSFSLPDPLDFPRIGELQEMFGVDNGFPKAQVNRTIPWPRPYDLGQVTSMAGNDSDVSIAIKSQLSGNNLSVEVKVVYENGSTAGDKLVVYLLENGVVAPQANYFNETPGHPYQGLGNPIPNYVHNDALRNSLSDLFGDPIPATPAFEVFGKNYSFTVPGDYVGENLSFVVMVVNADNSAKNSQFARINEDKKYE